MLRTLRRSQARRRLVCLLVFFSLVISFISFGLPKRALAQLPVLPPFGPAPGGNLPNLDVVRQAVDLAG